MVYLSGNINGSYRAQNIIKLLSDNKFNYFFIPHSISFSYNRYISKIFKIIILLLFLPVRLFLIILSSTIIVLPMNTNIYSLVDCFIARLLRKKIIYEYYISRYDTNVNDKKSYENKSYKAKYDLFLDKSLTKLATKIICLNNAESYYYENFMSEKSNSKIEIIPLVIDLNESVSSGEMDMSIIKYCWWGTYLPLHGLDKIIKAFYKSNNENSLLYIFGDSDEKAKEYIELVSELGLDNKVIFNHSYTFKNKKLPDFLVDNFVVALGNFGDSAKAKTVLVNKIVDAASLSLPILTGESKASSSYFENNISIVYTERNIDNIANEMNKINSGVYDLKNIGSKAKSVYLNKFSPYAFQSRYIEMLNEK